MIASFLLLSICYFPFWEINICWCLLGPLASSPRKKRRWVRSPRSGSSKDRYIPGSWPCWEVELCEHCEEGPVASGVGHSHFPGTPMVLWGGQSPAMLNKAEADLRGLVISVRLWLCHLLALGPDGSSHWTGLCLLSATVSLAPGASPAYNSF